MLSSGHDIGEGERVAACKKEIGARGGFVILQRFPFIPVCLNISKSVEEAALIESLSKLILIKGETSHTSYPEHLAFIRT